MGPFPAAQREKMRFTTGEYPAGTMRRRREELSKLFKRLYEDNVLGRVTDEQYRMLAGDYTGE